MPTALLALYRREFAGYSTTHFQKDLLAGLTVAAVALPLALAFGVASGADAAAGLVTAILAGFVIGGLGGAPYQISGPTGAMSAVLIVIAQRYGVAGVWVTGVMAGIMILAIGLLRLGRFVSFIPAPVIAGFTSGIAAIIFIGQIDNFLGVKTEASENAVLKLWSYSQGVEANWEAVAIGLIVIVIMLVWPKVTAKVPGSLVGILVATGVAVMMGLDAPTIGQIPRTILLEQRLVLSAIPWENLGALVTPAISIAALGAIESLLCGTVGGNMTGFRMAADTELVAQGLGNILIPFFGGVPATAAIARTSVGIKSGGLTRMVSFVHAGALLLAALLFGPLIGRVPLAALAGVLMVTAWRMNEWPAIRFYFGRRFKHAMATFMLTLLATVTLDLTQAILVGVALSSMVFISQISELSITREPVNVGTLREQGHLIDEACPLINVFYLSGPLFFGAARHFVNTIESAGEIKTVILSMRGVPLIDASGIEALHEVWHKQRAKGGALLLAGVHPGVKRMLERAGMVAEIGAENFFWSADRAILAAEYQRLTVGCTFCTRPSVNCPLREAVQPEAQLRDGVDQRVKVVA